MSKILEYIGKRTLNTANYFFNLSAFAVKILSVFFDRKKAGKALIKRIIVEQIYFTAVQALPIIIIIALITGSVFIIQFSIVKDLFNLGKSEDLSKMTIFLLVREIGPLATALIVILRSATAVTIEISYMSHLNEFESIEMAGADPMKIIFFPRLIGITFAIFSLFIVFNVVSIFGGYGLTWLLTDFAIGNILDQFGKVLQSSDIIVGIIKTLLFGTVISVICIYNGLSTHKKITNIPSATSKAALNCFIFCLVINIFLSILFYI